MSAESPAAGLDGREDLTEVVDRLDTLEAENERLREENEQLRERVDELEDDVEENQYGSVTKTSLNMLLEGLVTDLDVDDYTRDPMQSVSVVEEFGKRLSQTVDAVDENAANPNEDPMTANWQACVEHANTLRNDSRHARSDEYVALYVRDVANATGNSKRYCRDLVEKLGREHRGAKYQPPKENPKQGGENRKKALLVSMKVWGDE